MHITTSKTLSNGLLVIVNENSSSPIIDLQLVVRAGSAYEKEDQLGYAHILEHMLLKGTKRRPTSYDIGLEIDRIGAYSNASTSSKAAWFIMEAAAPHAEKLFDVMSDNLLNSLIDAKVLENEKKVILGEVAQRNNMLIRKSLFGALTQYTDGHPIARDSLGIESSILTATPEALRVYKEKFYIPSNCALIISGNINSARAGELAEKYFGHWEKASVPDLELPIPKFQYKETGFQEHPTDATYLTLCYGLDRGATIEEDAAIELVVSLLGYGYTSLIMHELRNKRGLIYSSGTNARHHTDSTIITIGTNTNEPDEVVKAINGIVGSLEKVLTDEVIAAMKTQVSGITERKIAEPEYVRGILRNEFIQFGKVRTLQDYLTMLEGLSPDFVRATCKLFFDPNHMFAFALGKKPLSK